MLYSTKALFIVYIILLRKVLSSDKEESSSGSNNDNVSNNSINTDTSSDDEEEHENKKEVENTINEKVKELKPFLQDSDVIKDIEQIAKKYKVSKISRIKTKNNFNEKIIKYKNLRDIINKQLIIEKVSNKIRNGVIKTIDVLIQKISNDKCNWYMQPRAENAIFSWDEELQRIKKNLILAVTDHKSNLPENTEKNYKQFLDYILRLLKYIITESSEFPTRFKIQCSSIQKSSEEENNINKINALRDKNDLDTCKFFKVCSTELKNFILDFYEKINDSIVAVLSNYAEMYYRDVNNETEQNKNTLIIALKKLSKIVKRIVAKIFIEDTKKINLDKDKNIKKNIRVLSNYIKIITERIVKNVNASILRELQTLRVKSIQAIIDDITINSALELQNLANEFIGKLCDMFQLCNEAFKERRYLDSDSKHTLSVLETSVNGNVTKPTKITTEFKYNGTFIVTRTTYINLATQNKNQ